jgi:hypothetical protein
MIWLIAILVAVACTPPLTPTERDCLATVEAHEDAELLVCVAQNGDGKCPNATIDEIADRHDVAAERCVQ